MTKDHILVCIAILLLQSDHFLAEKKVVDVAKIVDAVNKNKYLPWKADSYGQSEIDVDVFAKTKLGVKFDKNDVTYKRSNPRNLIKKATVATTTPDTDYMGLPTNFTWANKTLTSCPIGKIRDQSNCGSCWAVSTAAALGDRFCIQTKGKNTTALSHEFIVACDKKDYGCYGGYMQNVNEFMVINGTITGGEYESDEGCQEYTIRPCGFPAESSMPCTYRYPRNPQCKLKKCNNEWYPHEYEPDYNVFKAKSWTFISANYTHSREDRIRDEIYKNGPVTAAFWVFQDFITYKKGVYVPSPRAYYMGGHAVRVIGWGVENGLKYWHAANSWSESWGENGFFKIVRGVNSCAFEGQMTAFELALTKTT